MLSKDEFVRRILDGAPPESEAEADAGFGDAMLEGFDAFDVPEDAEESTTDARFAQLLLEESGFGRGETLPRGEVVLGDQKTNRFLPHGATYWAKTTARPFHILLFDLELKGSAILSDGFFRQNDQLEDALHRIVQDALEGFERGGEGRTADRKKGAQAETLCVVSVIDDRRDGPERQIVCFGTKCTATDALEVFTLREEARDWDRPLAEEHLGQLFERHFKRLSHGARWQEAFVSGAERKKAAALVEACRPKLFGEAEETLKRTVRDLLDEIAWSFGIPRKKANQNRCLEMVDLPANHSIAVDPDESRRPGFTNALRGVRIYDSSERLLGFIVYFPSDKADLERLRTELRTHNHFHNVLVIYPKGDGPNSDPELELWQGPEPLRGRLVSGNRRSRFDGEGGIVQLLSRFFVVSKSAIDKPSQLATELAWRARHLKALAVEELARETERGDGPLKKLFDIFNQALATLDETQFADAYAQTITYGLLAARWLSSGRQDVRFARKNIDALLPSTSPFLHDLFQRLVNSRFDQNLSWLLDDITSLLSRTMVAEVFQGEQDPSIHFYQDFLDAYDPQIRKDQGVYYTPDEVVSYIVRTAHTALQERFGLALGLADTTSWAEFAKATGIEVPEGVEGDEPFVQVLDPATGTGTFLLRVIEVIHETMMTQYAERGLDEKASQREWGTYVRAHLLPRINGFELMMAPYIVSHLRLGLALQQTGFTFSDEDRLRVFLTNALEPAHARQLELVSEHVAEESALARRVKVGGRTTVLIGNPPYSSAAGGGTAFSSELLERYMKGLGVENERKKGVLRDDYVRFIAFAEWILHRAGLGVMGLVTNNSYLDGTVHRAMRHSLLGSFCQGDIVDLGGSARASATVDENVFNIIQGVAILSATMMPSNPQRWRHTKIEGSRGEKLARLQKGIDSWTALKPREPFYLLKPFDESRYDEFQRFTSLRDLFPVNSSGIETEKDHFAVDFTTAGLQQRINDFLSESYSDDEAGRRFKVKTTPNWDLGEARRKLRRSGLRDDLIVKYLYKPFDYRFTYYSTDIITRPRSETMDHMLGENLAIVAMRQVKGEDFAHVFITELISNKFSLSSKSSNVSYHFPLMLSGRVVPQANLNKDFIRSLERSAGFRFDESSSGRAGTAGPHDVFRYVCAVLFSEEYRRGYAEYLSKDFPRIPSGCSPDLFQELVSLGGRIVDACLLRLPPTPGEALFDDGGSRLVEKAGEAKRQLTSDGTLRINKRSSFQNVPLAAWDYFVGGYSPCHKWLSDRKRAKYELSDDDIEHFRRIVAACKELRELVASVDDVIDAYGGWPGAFEGAS